MLLAAIYPITVADAAPTRAWFWLSSDQIRALRDISPAPCWSSRGSDTPTSLNRRSRPTPNFPRQRNTPTGQGTIVLGPDYVVIDDMGGRQEVYCSFRQISSERARQLAGRYFAPSASDNMVRSLMGNPFISGFYFDAGMWLVGNWNGYGWRLIGVGEALGGGAAKSDAYDKDFIRLKRDLMSRYAERF